MKRTATENQFIIVTLLLVSLLGMRTAYSLTEEDEEATVVAVQVSSKLESSAGSSNPLGASRSPASIPSKTLKPKSSINAFVDLDLSCEKKLNALFKTSGQYVQFKGKNCLKNFNQEKIEIVNKSNGFTASVFPFGKDQYQTDMIRLVEGENQITIRYLAPVGAKYEKTITVNSNSI